jgi:MtrB/PioB family decaheme-associated outer membrane protein
MRMRAFALLTALLLVPAAGASAQDTPAEPKNGSVDFGGQFTSIDGDEARYDRYRDSRNGPLLDAFKYTREKDDWLFDVEAGHIGYRDQKYVVAVRKYDRVKIKFTWDQTPLFYSTGASDQYGLLSASPYQRVGPGEYRINDDVQRTLQGICPTPPCSTAAGAARQARLSQLMTQEALPVDIEHRRDTALLEADVRLTGQTHLLFRLLNVHKEGTQPWAAPFGFSGANEIAGPVDYRNTDIGAALEWANSRGMVKVGWDGSWFTNNVSSLVFDNPLRLTDTTYASGYSGADATSQGRMDLWPDSTMQMVSGTATYKLGRGLRAYGNLGLAKWTQDDQLLPHTINSVIPAIALARQSAEAEVDVTSLLVGLSGRPASKVWMNVRYKLYDYDNKMEEFPIGDYVRFDQNAYFHEYAAEPFGYRRQYFDADASFSVLPMAALRVGFGRESDERTFREFEETHDNTLRLAFDTTGWSFAMLRLQYDFSKRTGDGLDEHVFTCDEDGRACPRQFDIADRDRTRVSFMGSVNPSAFFSIDAQVGVFRDERPDEDTAFGVVRSDGDFYSVGLNVTPSPRVAFGVTYGKDKYSSLQRSRQANPGTQEFDARRDWTTEVSDDVDTVYAYVDLLKALPKTDVRYAFDWSDGVNDITYGLRPDQTIFVAPAALRQLPDASHELKRSMLELMYRVNRKLGIGLSWLYEDYAVDDWAWNQATVNGPMLNPTSQPGGVSFLSTTRYLYRPYTGNTVMARVRYFW